MIPSRTYLYAIAVGGMILAGAGCKRASLPPASVDPGTLRTPPPATAPVQEPAIPPEAKNVPRPY